MYSYLATYLFTIMLKLLLQALHRLLPRANSKNPTEISQSIVPANASHRILVGRPLSSSTQYYQTVCTNCDIQNYCSPQCRTTLLPAHRTVVLLESAETPYKQTDTAELRYLRRRSATQASSIAQKHPNFHPPGNK